MQNLASTFAFGLLKLTQFLGRDSPNEPNKGRCPVLEDGPRPASWFRSERSCTVNIATPALIRMTSTDGLNKWYRSVRKVYTVHINGAILSR